MKNFTKQIYCSLTVLALLTILAGCKKAENYYQKLDAQPEVRRNYGAVYGVGDTLTLTGRLNPQNNLQIRVGGIIAKIESITRQPVPRENNIMDTLERAKVVITKEMGIGVDRKVEVTSGGTTVQGPSIQIVESIESGVLPAPLQLMKHADLTTGTIPLFCQNGKGSIYLYQPNKAVVRIGKSGASTSLFNGESLTDQFGQFSIITFNSGGVDPQEQNLYFSAVTSDGNADNAGNTIFRLCRYNLQNNTLTTMNRSVYPNTASQRILSVFSPYEGTIGAVKIFAVAGIYPDSKGNVFLNVATTSGYVRLSANGQVKYLFRAGATSPAIYNPATGSNYSTDEVLRLLPGVLLTSGTAAFRAILPDENLIYMRIGAFASNIRQIDMSNAVEVYGFTPTYVPAIHQGGIPFISGTFDILTGGYETSNPPGLFGYLPLPGAKVLILYYQDLNSRSYPALGTLNFTERVGRRYAPGKLVKNGFVMTSADRMLNYDEEGMIYMTANTGTTIIKTTNQ